MVVLERGFESCGSREVHLWEMVVCIDVGHASRESQILIAEHCKGSVGSSRKYRALGNSSHPHHSPIMKIKNVWNVLSGTL